MTIIEDLTKEVERMKAGGSPVSEIEARAKEMLREHNRRTAMTLWFEGLMDGTVTS